jgi:hypothetical protein
MKRLVNLRIIKYILFQVLVLGASGMGISQELNPILDRFSAFEINNTVQIECVISSGNTCNGIDIFRSIDSVNFEIIGNIAGVCGSTSSPVTYRFRDQNPQLNSANYYKLELGGYGFTQAIAIIIRDIEEGKIRVSPNPTSGLTQLLFKNPVNHFYQLVIRNLVGESIFVAETNVDFFELNVANWNAGYYVAHLYSKNSETTKVGVMMVVY